MPTETLTLHADAAGHGLHCPAHEPPAALARRSLPCLDRLTGLTALSLAES